MYHVSNHISPTIKCEKTTVSPHMPSNSHLQKMDPHLGRDYTDFSSEWTVSFQPEDLVQKTLDALRKSYPKVQIFITDGLGKDSLNSAAASLGNGTHLILSQDFVDRMGSSEAEYVKCKSVLNRILEEMSSQSGKHDAQGAYVEEGGVSFWTADAPKPESPPHNTGQTTPGHTDTFLEKMPSPKASSSKKNSFYTHKADLQSISYSYARLAGASTKSAVRSVMSDTRRIITDLNLIMALGSDKEKAKARTIRASMQKLLLRGNRKIRKLTEEDLIKLKEKKARMREQEEKEMALRLEQKRMQAKRRNADHLLVAEGQLETINQTQRYHQMKESRYEGSLPVASSIPILPSAPVMANTAGSVDAAFAAADVAVSETISF